MNDDIEHRLRRDLHAHAEHVTGEIDAVVVSSRWDDVEDEARRARADDGRPSTRSRVLVAAAGLVAVAGIGVGAVQTRGGDQEVSSATPTSTPATVVEQTPDTTVPVDPEPLVVDEATPETTVTTVPPLPVVDISDVAGTPTEVTAAPDALGAAARFLDQLGVVGDVDLTIDDGAVLVWAPTESGEMRVVSRLIVGTYDDGGETSVVVLEAGLPGTVELDPLLLDHVGPAIPVAGRGHGFESVIDLSIVATEGAPQSAPNYATGGALGEVVEFVDDHQVAGSGRGWMVARSSDPSGAIEPFAAVPVGWDSGRSGEARVFRIAVDDPDGGLVLRADPDGASDRLGVIPAGAMVETFERDGAWVRVRDERGVLGWAGSSYLTVADAKITDEELLAVGAAFERAFVTERGDAEALAAVPWTDEFVVPVGWSGAFNTFTAEELLAADAADREMVWRIPDAFDPSETTLSTASFFGLTVEEYSVVPRHECCVQGNDQAVMDSWFGGLPTVSFLDVRDSGWRNVHLVVEPSKDGPRIVGVVVELWIP